MAEDPFHRRVDEFCDNRLSKVRQRLLHRRRAQDDASHRSIDRPFDRGNQIVPRFLVCFCQFGIKRLDLADILLVGELLFFDYFLLGPDIILRRVELLLVIGLVVRPFEVEEILLLPDLLRSRNLAEGGLVIDCRFVVSEFRIRDLLIGLELVELIAFGLHSKLLFQLVNVAFDRQAGIRSGFGQR